MSEVELQGLQFEIKANADSATTSVDKLSGALKSLDEALHFNAENSGFSKLASIVDKIPATKMDYIFESLKKFRFSKAAAENIRHFVDALETLTPDTIEKWKEIHSALSTMPKIRLLSAPKKEDDGLDANQSTETEVPDSGVEKVAEAAESASSRIGVAMGSIADKLAQIGKAGFDKIAERWSAALSKASTAAKSFLKNIATLPVTIGKRLATSVKQSTAGLGQFFSSLKRIAFYRLIRSALKALTQGFAEGQKNLYQYSKLMGTQFYQSMDRLSSASLYLKNSLAAMAAPLINAVTPAIEFAIDKIVQLFNWVNKLISALTGKTITTVAKKVTKDFDDAAERAGGSARKAADELKRTILAFDELNVLNDTKEHGGGTGGGTNNNADDYGAMFEEVEVESYFSDLADKIRNAFAASDWEGLGRILGDQVNKLFDGIDFGDIGSKVGSGINGAIKTAYYFLDEVNFTNIGKKIMQFLNNMVGSIEWKYVGGLPVKFVTSILDLLLGAVDEWDPWTLAKAISDFVVGAFDELAKWVKEKNWLTIGVDLGYKLSEFLMNIDWATVLTQVLITVGNVLGGLTEFAFGLLGAFISDVFLNIPQLLTKLLGKALMTMLTDTLITTGLINTELGHTMFIKGAELVNSMIEGAESANLPHFLSDYIAGIKVKDIDVGVKPSVDKKGVRQFHTNLDKEIKKSPVSVLAEIEDNTLTEYESYRKNIRTLTQRNPLTFNTDVIDDSVKMFDKTNRTWNNYTKNRSLMINTQVADNGKSMYNDTKTYYDRASTKGLFVDTHVNNNGAKMWSDTKSHYDKAKGNLWASVQTWDQGSSQWKTTEKGWNAYTKDLDLTASVTTKFGNKLDMNDAFKNYTKTISIKPSFRKPNGSSEDKAILNVFGLSQIPTFKLAAKGGIVDAATLFGGNIIAGEAGREAIVPLDRNTEWMDMVASRVNQDDNEDVYASMYAALTDFYSASMRSTMNQIAEGASKPSEGGMMTANEITAALARKNLRDGRTVIPIG